MLTQNQRLGMLDTKYVKAAPAAGGNLDSSLFHQKLPYDIITGGSYSGTHKHQYPI